MAGEVQIGIKVVFLMNNQRKIFLILEKVISYEPARNYHDIESCDCVVCFDVLEHVYLNDLNDMY